MDKGSNVVLIGMPGAGKSTVGVLLAKRLAYGFVDTDVALQTGEGRSLQEIIDNDGIEVFRGIEERYVAALSCSRTVIATGGSVVYSTPAISALQASGVVVFLDVPLAVLAARLGDMTKRGLVRRPGQSLEELYAERRPLYRQAADLVVSCEGLPPSEVVERVLMLL